MEKDSENERLSRAQRSAKERLSELEKDRKDLADEYVSLKSNYLALNKEYGNEVSCFSSAIKHHLNSGMRRHTYRKLVYNFRRWWSFQGLVHL